MPHRTIISCALLVIAFLATGACISRAAPPAAVAHASHRAYYEVDIGRVAPGADVVDARGGMVAEWSRNCEGWTSNQRLFVSMSQSSGDAIDSSVSLSSFESLDGTLYRFDAQTKIGGETVEEVRGKAERPGRGQPGVATYQVPGGTTVELPADTLFPYEHTVFVLEAAEQGERRAYSHYFDGAQPEISPMTANALVLGDARTGVEGPLADLGEMVRHKWWPVRLAMFASGDRAEQPEFEMSQVLQDNGVVREFEFDYGNFSIVASLVRIEKLDIPACN